MFALSLLVAIGLSPQSNPDSIDQILRSLPTDTETAVVINDSILNLDGKKVTGASILGWPVCFSQDKLKALAELPMTSVVFGARKFQYPDEIGVGAFEGAWIATMPDATLEKARAILAKNKFNSSKVAGRNALSCAENFNAKEIRHFYVVIEDHTLIVATNTGYLEALLKRKAAEPTDRPFPDWLEEWKYVERNGPFWAIRHVNPATQLKMWGLDMHDKQIRGFGISMRTDGSFRVVNVSDNPHASEIAKEFWGGDQLKPIFTSLTKTANEILIDKDPKQIGMAYLYLSIALGYAIAI